MHSRLWERKIETHEIQTIGCDGEPKADENRMSAGPHRFMIMQEVREIWRTTGVQGFEGQGGKFKPYMPFDSEPMELFKKFI